MKYKLKEFGTEYNKILDEFKDAGSDRIILLGRIREQLIKCVEKDDLIKALAIIEYAEKIQNYTSNELHLVDDTKDADSIITTAHTYEEQDRSDFAIELAGLCKTFGYIDGGIN